eukprot:g1068.t1 g1068   contig10:1314007-1315833(+)
MKKLSHQMMAIVIVLYTSTPTKSFTSPRCFIPSSSLSWRTASLYQLVERYKGPTFGSAPVPFSYPSITSLHANSDDRDTTSPNQDAQQSASSPFVGLPSYRRIIFFVATTVLIWISEPLLSLVDSAAVGRYAGKTLQSASTSTIPNLSSVIQLASLGPATMLCDSSIYLSLFIAMATTNKLATSFAKEDLKEQISTISHVMAISLAIGTTLFLLITFRGESLLSSILGPAGATITAETAKGVMETVDLTPQVLHAALGYSRIRSAVYPLAVMGLTSQAALLCAGNTQTPALAVFVASIANIIGDYFFVAKMGFGVRGAALATSIASVLANGILVFRVWKMRQSWKEAYGEKRNTQQIQTLQVADDPSLTPFISFPNRKDFVSLLKLAGPMFFVLIGKVMGYSAMTVKAGSFGMVSLACHNVLMRVFFFFATCGDGISHAAQTFLPGLFYRKSLVEGESSELSRRNNAEDDQNARTLLKRLLSIATVAGTVNCIAGRYIANNAGRVFTTDTSLVSLMSHVSPFMGLGLLIHPITMALEGSIIAGRDLKFLVSTYVLSITVLLAQLKFVCKEFVGVWHTLLLFQSIRIVQFGARVWRRTASSKGNGEATT